MNKLNLNQYSDREIVAAFVDLSMAKSVSVMNALAKRMQKYEKRGKEIGEGYPETNDERIVRLFLSGGLVG